VGYNTVPIQRSVGYATAPAALSSSGGNAYVITNDYVLTPQQQQLF